MSTQKQVEEKIVPGSNLVFGKENYLIMILGLIVIFIGFALMAGGNSEDPNVFNPEVFSTRRIVIAPTVVIFGFIIEAYAIFRKTKD